ncbi:MAG TPA: hypothetical protein VJV39_08930 [Dongiaceae bacterium]|nr:hypothetical protein [Dongiaceae bacterium]
MTRIAPIPLLFAAAILLTPFAPALAISNEEAPAGDDGAQVADPDDAIDQFANPDSGTGGDATIEVPPIAMPDDGSNDYLSPDADDDPAVPPQQGEAN